MGLIRYFLIQQTAKGPKRNLATQEKFKHAIFFNMVSVLHLFFFICYNAHHVMLQHTNTQLVSSYLSMSLNIII